jgi:hypothetical protein
MYFLTHRILGCFGEQDANRLLYTDFAERAGSTLYGMDHFDCGTFVFSQT